MKIIKDKKFLSLPTQPVASISEGEEIAKRLLETLSKTSGIGLTANQVGIRKSVCVVMVKSREPIVMINPRVTNQSNEKLIYYEGCLSIPNTKLQTVRHKTITVACDNWANERTFGPDNPNDKDWGRDEGLLECVCVQHEICHTMGILMTDDSIRYRIDPVVNKVPKLGRNDKVFIQKGEKTERVKYKKALEMQSEGWKII